MSATGNPIQSSASGSVAFRPSLARPFLRLGIRRQPLSARGIAVRLFFTCWVVFGLHFATNTVREIYPALTLGDHLTFDVSEYSGLHPDIFEIEGRGAYINNNPGASIIGAIPYIVCRPAIDWIVQRAQKTRSAGSAASPATYKSVYPLAQEFYLRARERGIDVKLGLGAGVMQTLAMAPLSALSTVIMFYILASLTGSKKKSLLLALLYAFATPILYRTAQLNQNLLVSHSAFFAFAVLWRPWDKALDPKRPNYLLAGLLCGWAVVLDYSGLVAVLVLSVYGLIRRASLPATAKSNSDIPGFLIGVMVCAAFLMAYQWSAFGNPFLPAQSHMPHTRFSGFGYHGMGWPQIDLLWATLFDLRFGLFTFAPLLLLGFYFPGWARAETRLLGNRELWFIVTFASLFVLFCSANQYGRLQFNSGVRYMLPVVPFLFFLVAGVLLQMHRAIAVLIGVVATYWSWCLAMYRDVEQGLGVIEAVKQVTLGGFRLPWMTTLNSMGYLTDLTTPLPLLLLSAVLIWVLWRTETRPVESRG